MIKAEYIGAKINVKGFGAVTIKEDTDPAHLKRLGLDHVLKAEKKKAKKDKPAED